MLGRIYMTLVPIKTFYKYLVLIHVYGCFQLLPLTLIGLMAWFGPKTNDKTNFIYIPIYNCCYSYIIKRCNSQTRNKIWSFLFLLCNFSENLKYNCLKDYMSTNSRRLSQIWPLYKQKYININRFFYYSL